MYQAIQNQNKFKIWLRNLRACFVVPLNESTHRKSEKIDLEPVIKVKIYIASSTKRSDLYLLVVYFSIMLGYFR